LKGVLFLRRFSSTVFIQEIFWFFFGALVSAPVFFSFSSCCIAVEEGVDGLELVMHQRDLQQFEEILPIVVHELLDVADTRRWKCAPAARTPHRLCLPRRSSSGCDGIRPDVILDLVKKLK